MSIKPCTLKGLEEKFTIANKNGFYVVQIVCPVFKFLKISQEKILSNFNYFRCWYDRNLKMDAFLQKLKKVVRVVLYGPAISQSDCRKAGPYQPSYNNVLYCIVLYCIVLYCIVLYCIVLYCIGTKTIFMLYLLNQMILPLNLVVPCLCKRVSITAINLSYDICSAFKT